MADEMSGISTIRLLTKIITFFPFTHLGLLKSPISETWPILVVSAAISFWGILKNRENNSILVFLSVASSHCPEQMSLNLTEL